MRRPTLAVIATHPIQYQAGVYRLLRTEFGIPAHVIYGSDFSIAGYYDREFGCSFAWQADLVREGDGCTFLARVAGGGAADFDQVSANGLGKALEEIGAGAVLLTGYAPAFNLRAIAQARRRRLPILFRAETTDHTPPRSPVRSWIRDAMLRCLYAGFHRLLPIGSRSYQHYRRLGCSEARMIFSPYCVDTAPFRCADVDREKLRTARRRSLGLQNDDVAVLFSGKLSHRKGPHLLVDAAKRLPAELRSRVVLVFLGDGQERENLTQRAQRPPAVQSRFEGFRNQPELSPYYHAADLLVLPSIRSETWGLVVNEALHHGVPCVVSDAVGCAPDLVVPGVTGEVAAAGCVESLSQAIGRSLKLIRDPQVREGCRRQVSGYTAQRAAEGIATAYRTLA